MTTNIMTSAFSTISQYGFGNLYLAATVGLLLMGVFLLRFGVSIAVVLLMLLPMIFAVTLVGYISAGTVAWLPASILGLAVVAILATIGIGLARWLT